VTRMFYAIFFPTAYGLLAHPGIPSDLSQERSAAPSPFPTLPTTSASYHHDSNNGHTTQSDEGECVYDLARIPRRGESLSGA
jgi:hypothetical protein